jgi:multidrug resistance efflux pump
LEWIIPAIEAKKIEEIRLPQGLQLAPLQPIYSQLSELMTAQQFQLAKDDVQRKIRIYENELEQIRQLNQLTDVVIDTLKQEVFIAKNNQDTYFKLFKKGAASQQEYEEAKNNYLRYQRELENKKADYSRNQLEAQIRQNQIITLTQTQDNEIKKGWRSLEEAARQLQAAFEEWEANYLIKAPASGRIVFSEIWSDFQSVTEGAIMMTIDPEANHQAISVRARLPVAKSGKVRKGQEVLLRLQAYPYKEFGVLEGSISEMAPLPEPGEAPFYRLQISLRSDSLLTTSNHPIPFTQEMRATARIITEDRSFLGRILDDLSSILAKN